MNKYDLSYVYNEAAIPGLTFVEPKEFLDIVGSLKTNGKHISLNGPSGCGKTTLIKKAFEKAGYNEGNTHWISARDYSEIETFEEVFSKEFNCSTDEKEILEYLKIAGMLVIDDFHHFKQAVKKKIAYSLKRWNELEIRVVVIGIASSTKELLDMDSELSIRNDPYEMKRQDDKLIEKIITKGEEKLNIKFSTSSKAEFIVAANGIPSAIQSICRIACIRSQVLETNDTEKIIDLKMKDIRDGVMRIYKSKYHNKVLGLARGKQQAKSVHNTYFDIIKQLCLIDEYEIYINDIKNRILAPYADPSERMKKNTSFTNCIKNLKDVIKDKKLDDTLYFNENAECISIEDPSFRLYLNIIDTNEIEKAVKVRKTTYPWDVALSFAGEDREIVKRFTELVNANGYTVFYDFDLQYQLWGENLRRKLSEVYKYEAQYMVIFLSKDYPEKDWTQFEFEIGKEASGKRTGTYLLPLIINDTHIVGLSRDIGYFDLRTNTIENAVQALIDKIEKTTT